MEDFAEEHFEIFTSGSRKGVFEKASYPFVLMLKQRDYFDPRNL
jgi:hypothetical protein